MTHLRPEELSATLDGALHGEARERAERHLAECAICRDALASLADQETKLRLVLEHDPGEAYFSNFAARVEDRIRAAGLQGAQARLDREGTWGWLLSPRRLAWAGAVAAVVGGAGIVMLTSRPQRTLLESPQIVEQSRPPSEDLASGAKQEQAPAEPAPADQKEGAAREARRADTGARLQQSNTMRDEQRAETSAEELARGTSSDAATPQRAKAVQRSASGEDVPVAGQATPFAAPPPKSEASGGLAGVKPRAAPMEQQSSGSSLAITEKKDRDASTTLCGRVLDAAQRPIAGATVVLADRGLVTNTAADGRFCLQASAGLHELSVMAVGYEPTRLQVRVEGETSEALVTLRPVSVLDKPLAKGTSPSEGGFTSASPASPSVRTQSPGGTSYGYLEQPSSAKANATLERARTASRTAESAGTAAAFDAAAAAWAKVVPIATPGAPRNDALYSVAEARFRAWQLGSTSSRAKSARSAIDALLKAELAGARKDQVTAWRAQLPR